MAVRKKKPFHPERFPVTAPAEVAIKPKKERVETKKRMDDYLMQQEIKRKSKEAWDDC